VVIISAFFTLARPFRADVIHITAPRAMPWALIVRPFRALFPRCYFAHTGCKLLAIDVYNDEGFQPQAILPDFFEVKTDNSSGFQMPPKSVIIRLIT